MLHHTTETSIDDDLFLTATTATNDMPAASIIYDTTTSNKVIAPSRHSRQQLTLESSFDSMEVVDMTSTWKMKIFVLVSMLSLPGKASMIFLYIGYGIILMKEKKIFFFHYHSWLSLFGSNTGHIKNYFKACKADIFCAT